MPWPNTQWTEEQIQTLRRMWEEGYSAGVIALWLKTTRNAVIGKLKRLGILGTRGEPRYRFPRHHERKVAVRPTVIQVRPAHLLKTEQATEQPLAPPHRWVSLLDLRPRQCRWPHGDGPFKFCGAAVMGELSYCEQHARAAYPGLRK